MAGVVTPEENFELPSVGPTPVQTRVRLSDAEVQTVAQRADDLFKRRATLSADEQRDLARDEKTLESVLEGSVFTQTGARISEGTISKIRKLDVVKALESTPSEWIHEMTQCHDFFSSSEYLNSQLATSDDPEHPSLGDYLEGLKTNAVIQEVSSSGPSKAHIEGVSTLEMEITPLPNQQKFRVTVTVPKGEEALFGGVGSSTTVYDSFEEAKQAIEGVLKQAKALSAEEAFFLAQEHMVMSRDGLASRWASKFRDGCPSLRGESEALRFVKGSPRPGSMRYIPWKREIPRRQTEYFLAVQKEGQPPKNYALKINPCPWKFWDRYPRLVVVQLGGGAEEAFSLKDLEHQEERLKAIFGVTEVDLVPVPKR